MLPRLARRAPTGYPPPMPLLARNALPAYARLADAGVPVLPADAWSGPRLRVGLVNAMADAALEATERQLLGLLAAAAPDRGVELIPAELPEIPRGEAARRHLDAHYEPVADLSRRRLDALIVTGANVPDPDLDRLPFRAALVRVLDWARDEVPTTLHSCLASHAVLHFRHGRPRRRLAAKRWGVFPHRVAQPGHPLAHGLADGFVAPHSRWNDTPADDCAAAGYEVILQDAEDGGVLLAASPDRRTLLLQGHPEYDPVSLVKEHARETARFLAGERADWPEPPAGIADAAGLALLAEHRRRALAAPAGAPPYPEAALLPHLHHRWRGSAVRIVGNWLAP